MFRYFRWSLCLGNFFKLFFVSKLRKPYGDISVYGHDWFDAQFIQMKAKLFIAAFDFFGNFRNRFFLNLSSEPFNIIQLFIFRIWCPPMQAPMKRMCNYDDILWSIIKLISINVMDSFSWLKVSAKFLFGNKAMDKNIPILGVGVVGHTNTFISHSDDPSAFPSVVTFSGSGMDGTSS